MTTSRKKQDRTEQTRSNLMDAALALFSEQGFDGVSIRDLENTASVQRGLLAYHFKDKEGLWIAMADRTFQEMNEAMTAPMNVMRDLNPREQIRIVVRHYVRFCASSPALVRLMTQEARHSSWRISYLVDTHIQNIVKSLREPVVEGLGLSERDFMHWYYLFAGGSSLLFSHAPERDLLFPNLTNDESMIERHADLMINALLGQTIDQTTERSDS